MVSTCCRHPGHLWITQPGAREAANNGTPRFRGDHCARRYLITTSARAPTVYALVTGCSSSIAAALGGMLMPALIYAAFTAGTPLIHGWGIPMATDTAFAVGVLALLHRHIPAGLTAFLTALAIIDDLGAILVIAVFYTETINLPFLTAAILLLLLLIFLNAAGIRRPAVYFLIGGLVPFGITLMTWLSLRLGLGQLSEGVQMRHIVGVGLLGGMGFTMSIFIASLGFTSETGTLIAGKTAILLASLIAGVSGFLWLRFSGKVLERPAD